MSSPTPEATPTEYGESLLYSTTPVFLLEFYPTVIRSLWISHFLLPMWGRALRTSLYPTSCFGDQASHTSPQIGSKADCCGSSPSQQLISRIFSEARVGEALRSTAETDVPRRRSSSAVSLSLPMSCCWVEIWQSFCIIPLLNDSVFLAQLPDAAHCPLDRRGSEQDSLDLGHVVRPANDPILDHGQGMAAGTGSLLPLSNIECVLVLPELKNSLFGC